MKLPFFASLSAVVCGAAFGAAARWLLALWLDTPDQPFSRATLSANWIGALLIGLAAGLADSLPDLPPYWKLWLITGLLGSLTTFSGFSLEIVAMLQQQRYSAAVLTACSTTRPFENNPLPAFCILHLHYEAFAFIFANTIKSYLTNLSGKELRSCLYASATRLPITKSKKPYRPALPP